MKFYAGLASVMVVIFIMTFALMVNVHEQREKRNQEAYLEGVLDAKASVFARNPYDPQHERHVNWARGFNSYLRDSNPPAK